MGRGRCGFTYQGFRDIYRRRGITGIYAFSLRSQSNHKKGAPTVPGALVDKLREMDPKALASILLERKS